MQHHYWQSKNSFKYDLNLAQTREIRIARLAEKKLQDKFNQEKVAAAKRIADENKKTI
jgi:hypothetical protein